MPPHTPPLVTSPDTVCVYVCACLPVYTAQQGPTPNKPPGKLGDSYPSFQPTHATDALTHVQAAVRLSSTAMQAAAGNEQPDSDNVRLLRREHALILALADRFAAGAAGLKANKWWQHETAYAQRLKELAEQEQVGGGAGG